MTEVMITPDNGNRDVILAILMLIIAIAAFTLLNAIFAVGTYIWYRLIFMGASSPFALLILHKRSRPFTFGWLGLLATALFIL